MTNQNNERSVDSSDGSITDFQHSKSISSRIDLKKTDTVLTIYIYPVHKFIDRLNPKAGCFANGCLVSLLALLIPSLIILNFLMILLVASILYYAVFKLVFLISLLLVPLCFPLRFTLETDYFFMSEFTKVYFMMNDRSFSLSWDFLGIKRQINGKTQDLRAIKIVDFKTLKKTPFQTQLCLTHGTSSHKFGFGLLRTEQAWLVQEINDFLGAWGSRHQSQYGE